MGLAFFFFAIFSILGISLLDGKTHWRCYMTRAPDPEDGTWELDKEDLRLCGINSRECNEGRFCGSRYEMFDTQHDKYVRLGWTEKSLSKDTGIYELNYNITNFDNIGMAFLTIFQCITMEGWTKIMNFYQDAYYSWFIGFYFVTCVVICSFFLLNLTIAVMLMKYEELDKLQENSKHKQELKQMGKEIKLPYDLIMFLINQNNI